jgi:hypothetical protein
MTVHSWYPPILFDSIQEPGKRYIIADGKWTEVDNTLTQADIKWVKMSNTKEQSRVVDETKNKSWSVDGSKGNKYTVTLINNIWSCTCPAFNYSGNGLSCKHIQNIKMMNNL